MPRVTQYIRDEDMAAWNTLENKSAWIHEHLNEKLSMDILKQGKGGRYNGDTPIKDTFFPAVNNTFRENNGLCKIHGTPLDSRGKCLQKGCKYA